MTPLPGKPSLASKSEFDLAFHATYRALELADRDRRKGLEREAMLRREAQRSQTLIETWFRSRIEHLEHENLDLRQRLHTLATSLEGRQARTATEVDAAEQIRRLEQENLALRQATQAGEPESSANGERSSGRQQATRTGVVQRLVQWLTR